MADTLLDTAGYDVHYDATNPFTWMDAISMVQKNNFFEVYGGNYSRMTKAVSSGFRSLENSRDDQSDADNVIHQDQSQITLGEQDDLDDLECVDF